MSLLSNNILIYSVGISTIGLSYYLYNKMNKISILYHLTKQLMKPSSSLANFTLNNSMKSASIKYSRNGKEYLVHIPYRRNLLSKITSSKIYGVRKIYDVRKIYPIITDVFEDKTRIDDVINDKDITIDNIINDELIIDVKRKDEVQLDYTIISHPPGIPFLVSARDLGFDYILVVSKSNDNDKTVETIYNDDEIPIF